MRTRLYLLVFFFALLLICQGTRPFPAAAQVFTQAFGDNFENDPVGAQPAGWAAVGSPTLSVQAVNPVSPPNAFGSTSVVDGAVTIYKGIAPQTDPYELVNFVTSLSGGNFSNQSAVICSSADGNTFYMMNDKASTNSILLYKCVNGNYNQVAAAPFTFTNGQQLSRRFWELGGTLYGRYWPVGSAEPSGYTISYTDPSPLTSGYSGLRSGTTGGGLPAFVDDFQTGTTSTTAPSPPVITPATSVNIHYSFLEWHPSSTNAAYMETNNVGAWHEYTVSGTTSVAEQYDLSGGVVSGVGETWSIDGGPLQSGTVAASLTLASGLATSAHDVKVWVPMLTQFSDRWVSPVSVVRLASVTLDSGGTLSSPTSLPAQALLVYHDSRSGEGGVQNALVAWPYLLGQAFSMETGVRGFASMGWASVNGSASQTGSIPPFYTPGNEAQSAWDKFDSTHSLFTGGLFPSNLGMIVGCYGVNDQRFGTSDAAVSASVQGFLTSARVATPMPTIPICIVQDYSGDKQSAVSAGFNAYEAAHPDAFAYLVPMPAIAGLTDSGPSALSADGVHPNQQGQAIVAAAIAGAIRKATNASKLIGRGRRLN